MQYLLRKYVIAVTACAFIICCAAANATIITVNTSSDGDDGEIVVECTLREAIAAAGPGDLINFSALFNSPHIIVLTLGPLDINTNLTIDGPGADKLTISGALIPYMSMGVINVDPVNGGTVTLDGLTIGGGPTTISGIANEGDLNVIECFITSNMGGGIVNRGYIAIESCAITLNESTTLGAGVSNVFETSTMVIDNSTISGNVCDASGLSIEPAGGISNSGSATISNCTVSGNTVLGGGNAGGICHDLYSAAAITIRSTIVAGNFADPGDNQDLFGDFVSGGYNLIGIDESRTGFSSLGDQTGTLAVPLDPMLDPLGYYGGATPTHRLKGGSPCIDKGNSFGAWDDQRDYSRPADFSSIPNVTGGDGSDIGAYEAHITIIITGRAVDYRHHSVPSAVVRMIGSDGRVWETLTNESGHFQFRHVTSHTTYTISITHNRYEFDPQAVTVQEDPVRNLVFRAGR